MNACALAQSNRQHCSGSVVDHDMFMCLNIVISEYWIAITIIFWATKTEIANMRFRVTLTLEHFHICFLFCFVVCCFGWGIIGFVGVAVADITDNAAVVTN